MYLLRRMLITVIVAMSCASLYAQDNFTVATTVEFVVDTDKVIQNEDYTYFVDSLVPRIVQESDNIESILLVGSASPEGPQSRNIYLAKLRANRIKSFLQGSVLDRKFSVVNNYSLFLEKTGVSTRDYRRLRATYIEVHFKKPEPPVTLIERDTIYLRDTIQYSKVDTVWLKEKPELVPILAIKTNLVSDLLATLNIQAELYTWCWGLSLEFDYTFPWWHKDYDSYLYYQILDGKAGIRKYLNNKYTGHWIGMYANTAIYDICFWNKDKGWQGEVYGAGLGYGYVFQSKKHPRWKFEPYIRVGWFNTRFDTYHASQPWDEKYYYNWYLRASDFVPRRFNMNYFGPTEIGFNLTFDLICVRKYSCGQ